MGLHRRWWPVGLLALLAALLAAWPGLAHAQTRWPVSRFEVFEGPPGPRNMADDLLNIDTDKPLRATVPLTPALKHAIEGYMGEVAQAMQAWGLNPARLPLATNPAGGRPSFRVHYTDFKGEGYARVNYECQEPFRVTMMLNAAKLTAPEDPEAPNSPQAPRRLTEKAYVDMAHELFHAVQRNSAFYKTHCEPPDWINEGQAEAVGQDLAWQLRRVKREDGQIARWGMRRYRDPLAVQASGNAHEEAYQTSSFWRYLAELAFARSNPDPAQRLPGPGVAAPGYGVDYSYLPRFLGDARRMQGPHGALAFLNRRLLSEPAFAAPLASIYPHFVATLAAYGGHRLRGNLPLPQRRDAWLRNTLGECWAGAGESDTSGFNLGLAQPSAQASRTLGPVAAGCVRVAIGAIPAGATLDVRAIVPSAALGRQLSLGVAGGERVATGLVGERSDGSAVVSWSLLVNPGDKLDLVLANVAKEPGDTARLPLNLALSLPGWLLLGDTAPPSAAPPAAAPNRPAAPRARPLPGANSGTGQTQGNSTTRAERQDDARPSGCGWPAKDFNGYCGPTLHIDLRSVPASVATVASVSATGGFMNQLLGSAALAFGDDGSGARFPTAAELDGLHVQISLPLPAYGTTPSHSQAMITAQGGGWPASGAYGPTDQMAGTQTYFAPSGKLVIEVNTPLELRGHFDAQLVALPLPDASRESLPTLPVIRHLRGSFVVTRPFEGEAGFAYLRPELDSLQSDLMQRMPGAPGAPAAFGPGAADAPGSPPPPRTARPCCRPAVIAHALATAAG